MEKPMTDDQLAWEEEQEQAERFLEEAHNG